VNKSFDGDVLASVSLKEPSVIKKYNDVFNPKQLIISPNTMKFNRQMMLIKDQVITLYAFLKNATCKQVDYSEDAFMISESVDEVYDESIRIFNQRSTTTKLVTTSKDTTYEMSWNLYLFNRIIWNLFELVDLDYWMALHKIDDFDKKFVHKTSHIDSNVIARIFDNFIDVAIDCKVPYQDIKMALCEVLERLTHICIDFDILCANTINIKSFVDLSKTNDKFDDIIHTQVNEHLMNILEIEDYIEERRDDLVALLKKEENVIKDYLSCGEGINLGQLSDFMVNIGYKPNQMGGLSSKPINTNRLMGLRNFSDYYYDSTG